MKSWRLAKQEALMKYAVSRELCGHGLRYSFMLLLSFASQKSAIIHYLAFCSKLTRTTALHLNSIACPTDLLQYSFFAFMVGSARGKYEVSAPAVIGHEVFERYYRVQQNTLELLIVFIPGMFLFSHYVHILAAAVLGLVFFVGRMIYYKTYIADPKSRALGFALSFLAAHALTVGGLVGAVLKLF